MSLSPGFAATVGRVSAGGGDCLSELPRQSLPFLRGSGGGAPGKSQPQGWGGVGRGGCLFAGHPLLAGRSLLGRGVSKESFVGAPRREEEGAEGRAGFVAKGLLSWPWAHSQFCWPPPVLCAFSGWCFSVAGWPEALPKAVCDGSRRACGGRRPSLQAVGWPEAECWAEAVGWGLQQPPPHVLWPLLKRPWAFGGSPPPAERGPGSWEARGQSAWKKVGLARPPSAQTPGRVDGNDDIIRVGGWSSAGTKSRKGNTLLGVRGGWSQGTWL